MLTVINHLGNEYARILSSLRKDLNIVEGNAEIPWELPPETDILLAGPSGFWRKAPPAPPPNWPSNLRWVQLGNVGLDNYPAWLFQKAIVTNSRGASTTAVAEFVLASMLAHEKRLRDCWIQSRAEWRRIPLGTLAGRTLGLVGFGSIGKRIAEIALAFEMKVVAYRRRPIAPEIDGVSVLPTLSDVFALADHLVLVIPLSSDNAGLIDAGAFAAMKPGVHFVNVSRGPLVDQSALVEALDNGSVASASLDVTDPEPLPEGRPLYTHPKVRISPHVAWSADDIPLRHVRLFVEHLKLFERGPSLLNAVDPRNGY